MHLKKTKVSELFWLKTQLNVLIEYNRDTYLLPFENVNQPELFLETHDELGFLFFQHFVFSK